MRKPVNVWCERCQRASNPTYTHDMTWGSYLKYECHGEVAWFRFAVGEVGPPDAFHEVMEERLDVNALAAQVRKQVKSHTDLLNALCPPSRPASTSGKLTVMVDDYDV